MKIKNSQPTTAQPTDSITCIYHQRPMQLFVLLRHNTFTGKTRKKSKGVFIPQFIEFIEQVSAFIEKFIGFRSPIPGSYP